AGPPHAGGRRPAGPPPAGPRSLWVGPPPPTRLLGRRTSAPLAAMPTTLSRRAPHVAARRTRPIRAWRRRSQQQDNRAGPEGGRVRRADSTRFVELQRRLVAAESAARGVRRTLIGVPSRPIDKYHH